jgi:steroid 5-alpha reductase family enzyme
LTERARGFALCTLAYLLALAAAVGVGLALRGSHPLILVGLADLAGTVVIFGFSVAFGNSSLYDPYWSVAPIPIAGYLLVVGVSAANPARTVVVTLLVLVWSVRLTFNWARGWRGLRHEDWRYVRIRGVCGRAYWPVSFLGIHLMPTVMVYLGCLPLWPALGSGREVGWIDGLAALVTVAGVWIEAAADRQLRRFVRGRRDAQALLTTGLWACSRHPNYFGEILFWWGLCLFGLSAGGPFWVGVGGVAITLLFLCVSLPLIERRMLERKPAYREERRRRSLLVPWPPRPDSKQSSKSTEGMAKPGEPD